MSTPSPPTRTGLYAGVMSGTSLDGLDAVLVHIGHHGPPRLVASCRHGFEPSLQDQLRWIAEGAALGAAALGAADAAVADAYAEVLLDLLQRTGVGPGEVVAAGCHGQTVHHAPQARPPFTMQIGDPNRIAVRSGLTVVADFRRRDMALGGQGAPLAPGFHDAVFRQPDEARAVLNLGGIANVTLLVPGQPTHGHDTGPANVLLDGWALRHLGQPFDRDGAWAATGQVHAALLQRLLAEPYFALPAPKSTGRERFNLAWLDDHLAALATQADTPGPADVQRTLLELTAITALRDLPPGGGQVLVCGGGAFNGLLLRQLGVQVPGWRVDSVAALGWAPDLVEAIAFAYFAHLTVNGLPGNLPAVTGASRRCVLGAVYAP